MPTSNSHRPGRHFLQIPGPTNVPERVLRAMNQATIDHRGPDFAEMAQRIQERLKPVFGTKGPVVILPSSGSGAWEAALVNTLSPGDHILTFETGHFASLWSRMAENLGLIVEQVAGDWRRGIDPALVEERLSADKSVVIKAVMAVHNETSTGTTSDISAIRAAMDRASHPALLMVDTISSLASMAYRHDAWCVDVTVGGSQKGLMLPPGLGFNAVSDKALAAAKNAKLTRSYWDWAPLIAGIPKGAFPYTPATNLLYGLEEALCMLQEEGLENVYSRHHRLAEATRRAVKSWGLEFCCLDQDAYSDTVTAVMVPDGIDADRVRNTILDRFDMSLGTGLGKMQGNMFRIGHLGDFNELMLAGTLCGVEMGLGLADVPHNKGGVNAALDYLSATG